jgi:hypothetical protein
VTEDPERLLRELRFRPRESLGAEIAGRARRGEVAKGGAGRGRVPSPAWRRGLAAAAVLALALGGGALLSGGGTVRVDQCCRDLDGGHGADDGYVVEARGRTIERLTLYEDLDGDGRLSAADRVRLVRGRAPSVAPDSVHRAIRVCCADLDGEGTADDGLLVLHGADERVVLAGIFERDGRAGPPALR